MHHTHMALLLAVMTTCGVLAADRYVAPDGNDLAAGSEAAPWQTMAKAISGSAAGDRIFLARGGTWRETFTLAGGRQLLAYGVGADPVITGSVPVTMTGTWVGNSNVHTAALATQALQVWVDGVLQPLARFPNSGFVQTSSGTTLDLIRSASGLRARAAGTWNGAQVRWHRWHWFWETRPITADNGGTDLTLQANATWESGLIGIPSGYFIDNDLDELDAAGEWFSSATQLYVYPPTGAVPASMQVEIATTTTPVTVAGATIRGIAFRRFAGTALAITSASTVEDCTFEQIGGNGIDAGWITSPLTIRGCVLRDIRNNGIVLTQDAAVNGTLIERNLLHRVGVQRGYGGNGPWNQVGILINVGTATVRLNRLIDIGYAGILLGNTAGSTAVRNVIVRAMATNNDGAGIYTYKGPNTMDENIILDSRGDQTAAEPFFPFGNGIWPEFLDGIANSSICDNTIAGCNGNGIALINNFTCQVNRNVLFDNLSSGLNLGIYGGNTAGQGHVIDDNVFATLAATRRLPVEGNLASWWDPATPSAGLLYENGSSVDFGLLRRSTFIVGGATQLARGDGGGYPVSATLAALAAAEPSWVQNSGMNSTLNAVLLINDLEDAADLPVPAGTWTRTDGSAVGATVNLAAFRSVVLIGAGAAPASPIYRCASGIDWRAAAPTSLTLPIGGGGGGGGSDSGTAAGGGGGGCGAGGATGGFVASLALAGLRRRRRDQ